MKKRIGQYRILLSVLLLAVIFVGGTMAYLTASDAPVVNTFALADVHTEIIEDSGGDEESKVVWVNNTGDSDVFVRCRVVVSAGVSQVEYVSAAPAAADRDADTIYVVIGDSWEQDPAATGASDYYYYKGILRAHGTTKTTPLVNGVYCGANVDADSFDVIVYQEGVIASGSYSLSAAQTAFESVT